jgi:hypothetical protein
MLWYARELHWVNVAFLLIWGLMSPTPVWNSDSISNTLYDLFDSVFNSCIMVHMPFCSVFGLHIEFSVLSCSVFYCHTVLHVLFRYPFSSRGSVTLCSGFLGCPSPHSPVPRVGIGSQPLTQQHLGCPKNPDSDSIVVYIWITDSILNGNSRWADTLPRRGMADSPVEPELSDGRSNFLRS